MENSLHVLILAAGLGTRLRPLTERIPKPLVPLVDASVLEHQVRLAKTLGNVRLHVNAHYLAGEIEKAAPSLGIHKVWVEQPDILGTGGPLHRFWAEGERGELLVLNGDCYSHADLSSFVDQARQSGAPCALLARDFSQINTLRISKEGFLEGIQNRFGPETAMRSATFTGFSWYSPEALSEIRSEEKDVRDFWKRCVEKNTPPAVILADDATTWIDMGNPEGLWRATLQRLGELNLKNYVEAEHCMYNKIPDSFEHAVLYKGSYVGDGAVVRNTILLEGAVVEPGETVDREIRARGIRWQL